MPRFHVHSAKTGTRARMLLACLTVAALLLAATPPGGATG